MCNYLTNFNCINFCVLIVCGRLGWHFKSNGQWVSDLKWLTNHSNEHVSWGTLYNYHLLIFVSIIRSNSNRHFVFCCTLYHTFFPIELPYLFFGDILSDWEIFIKYYIESIKHYDIRRKINPTKISTENSGC